MRARLAGFGVFVPESDASVTFDQDVVEMAPEDETVSEICERLEKVASQGQYERIESQSTTARIKNISRDYVVNKSSLM